MNNPPVRSFTMSSKPRRHIPTDAWMRYRKQGRTLYGRKRPVIVWTTTPPPKGTKVYVVSWVDGQSIFMASEVVKV